MAANDTFEEEAIYHVYNRAISERKLFLHEKDYSYFLAKLKRFILPIAEVYAYCLLPNHFHLAIRVKVWEDADAGVSTDKHVVKKFSDFYNSYVRSFNKAHGKHGRLFDKPFKRVRIDSDSYFTQIIYYIHRNPVHHRLVRSIDEWAYSSYPIYRDNLDSFVTTREVLDWFGGRDQFIKDHQQQIQNYLEDGLNERYLLE